MLVGVAVGVRVGVFVAVLVGVFVGVFVGVLVGPGVPSDATTSPAELPTLFQVERTNPELFAATSDDTDFGTPAALTEVVADQVVNGLLASR